MRYELVDYIKHCIKTDFYSRHRGTGRNGVISILNTISFLLKKFQNKLLLN